tara:strand:- start:14 stop:202 length:189 start_codon:yes stop_codon:yes gene_type:complete
MNNDTSKTVQKIFIKNALEDGWEISEKNNSYILTKKHEGKKEYFRPDFLRRFMKNMLKIKYI